MKSILFFLIAVISMNVVNAQNITDGLRYANNDLNGSARFSSMSGAFGALGGDMSAVGINPAGSAVFLNSSAIVSFSVIDRDNEATYFNTKTGSIDTDVALNQAGGVFVFENPNKEASFQKFTLGLNYDATRNYDDELFITGTGNTSISEFFLAQAQGLPLDLLQLQGGETIADLYTYLGETEGTAAQNAFLGYQGFIFDPVNNDPSNTQYTSNIAPGSFNQEYAYLTSGYNGKFTINFATQVQNNFYFGINLNSHAIDYNQRTFLFESNNNPGSTVNRVGFENNLSVLGSGFSAQIGGIAKLAETFRVGLSFDTPTWYDISEETTQYLETRRTENGTSFTEIINPRVLNIYENYQLRTPGKISASTAYIFGKQGLISFDYSYKDYSNIEFGYDNDFFFDQTNTIIENSLKGASTFRLGGEYRINQLSLRGGLRYEESPYQNEETVGDLSGFSLGFGYNFGRYNLDLAYARSEQDRKQQLYDIGLPNSGSVNTINSHLTFSLGFNF